jgi:hypothetical protein
VKDLAPEAVARPDFAKRSKEGWEGRIALGLTASFANNSSVAGQVDGSSLAGGLKFDAGAEYNRGLHEWRNTVALAAGFTRTPLVPEIVKTNDNLSLESIYLAHLVKWFGPFVRVSLQTNMFRTTDFRPGVVSYLVTEPDGTTTTPLPGQTKGACGTGAAAGSAGSDPCTTRHALADPFRPLTLKQSAGVFFQPHESTPVTVELRLGLGAQEVIAKDQLAVKDDATTPTVIELQRLASSNQLGGEAAFSIWGTFQNKRVIYRADATVMTPFARTALAAGDTRNNLELTNLQLDAMLSFRLVDWASLDYQFKALRQPAVLDAFQIQNTLLLTFGLTYASKPAAPPAPAPAPPPPPAK